MCLAVPGKVLNVDDADPAFRTGSVDFCGVRKSVNLAFTPEVVPGDYVLVHVGFAISRVDEEEAARTYGYLAEIGALEEEGLTLPMGLSGRAAGITREQNTQPPAPAENVDIRGGDELDFSGAAPADIPDAAVTNRTWTS